MGAGARGRLGMLGCCECSAGVPCRQGAPTRVGRSCRRCLALVRDSVGCCRPGRRRVKPRLLVGWATTSAATACVTLHTLVDSLSSFHCRMGQSTSTAAARPSCAPYWCRQLPSVLTTQRCSGPLQAGATTSTATACVTLHTLIDSLSSFHCRVGQQRVQLLHVPGRKRAHRGRAAGDPGPAQAGRPRRPALHLGPHPHRGPLRG